MSRFLRFRRHAQFRRYFDGVHPLFWPVLYCQLCRLFKWMRDEQLDGVLFEITWWGAVHVTCKGGRIAAPTPNPFAPTRPRWDNPIWASDLPAAFELSIFSASLRAALRLPGAAGSILAPRSSGHGMSPDAITGGALPSCLDSS